MTAFESWMDYFHFRRESSRQQRYIRSEKSEAFLRRVAATSAAREVTIPVGRQFWRAALDHTWRHEDQIDDYLPYPSDVSRMTPWPDKAVEGRANAKGIPCLYVATTRDTALSEMRPWIGSLVSVATFQTNRALKVIDCSKHTGRMTIYWEEPPPAERANAVWHDIDKAFSEPVTKSDNTADYAPTQILAELFRSQGYDGVVYRSAFGDDGFNIALFDTKSAQLKNCFLFNTKSVKYVFSDTGEYY